MERFNIDYLLTECDCTNNMSVLEFQKHCEEYYEVKCDDCGKSYKHIAHCIRHKKEKDHCASSYFCTKCESKCPIAADYQELAQSLFRSNSGLPKKLLYECTCLNTMNRLETVSHVNENYAFMCQSCKETYSHSFNLSNHMKKIHNEIFPHLIHCKGCNTKFEVEDDDSPPQTVTKQKRQKKRQIDTMETNAPRKQKKRPNLFEQFFSFYKNDYKTKYKLKPRELRSQAKSDFDQLDSVIKENIQSGLFIDFEQLIYILGAPRNSIGIQTEPITEAKPVMSNVMPMFNPNNMWLLHMNQMAAMNMMSPFHFMDQVLPCEPKLGYQSLLSLTNQVLPCESKLGYQSPLSLMDKTQSEKLDEFIEKTLFYKDQSVPL